MQTQDNSWPVVDSNKMANTSHLALIIFWQVKQFTVVRKYDVYPVFQALLPTTQGSKYSYGQQHLSIPVAASTSEQVNIVHMYYTSTTALILYRDH